MRFFATALGLIGAATAAPTVTLDPSFPNSPAPGDVKIIGVTAIGSGCPVGHAFVNVDATGTIFDVAFDEYLVSVGPGSTASAARKNCRVSINLEFPEGMQ